MKLTKFQRKTLESYLYYQEHSPTIFSFFRRCAKSYVLFIIAIITLALISFCMHMPFFSIFLLGMLIGILGHDIDLFRNFAKLWPVLLNVLNWEKIQEFLSANKKV